MKVSDKQPIISLKRRAQLLVFAGLTRLNEDKSAPREVRGQALTLAGLFSRSDEVLLIRDRRFKSWMHPPKPVASKRKPRDARRRKR